MTLEEAIDSLSDGHSWWKLEYAKEICGQFGLELPDRLVQTYKSQKEANPDNHYKGLFFVEGTKFPVSGVTSLGLSDYITEAVLGETPSSNFIGRGFGAQANAEAIRKHFGL